MAHQLKLVGRRKDIKMEKDKKEIFTIPARRCLRPGGILTSEKGIRDGYGPCCLRKMQQEEREREQRALMGSLFDIAQNKE